MPSHPVPRTARLNIVGGKTNARFVESEGVSGQEPGIAEGRENRFILRPCPHQVGLIAIQRESVLVVAKRGCTRRQQAAGRTTALIAIGGIPLVLAAQVYHKQLLERHTGALGHAFQFAYKFREAVAVQRNQVAVTGPAGRCPAVRHEPGVQAVVPVKGADDLGPEALADGVSDLPRRAFTVYRMHSLTPHSERFSVGPLTVASVSYGTELGVKRS